MASKKKDDVKDEATQAAEANKEVVGTAADPKPPEPGSVGMNDGSKGNVDDLPAGSKTNVAEGASIADGAERVATKDGNVVAKDDLPAGTELVGGEKVQGDPKATPDDRGTSSVEPEGFTPAQLNPKSSDDPAINALFDPTQAPSPRMDNVPTGTTVGDEYPGNTPKDDRFLDVPPALLPPLKAAIDRVETSLKYKQYNTAAKALDDLEVVINPIDAGKGSKIRDYLNEKRAQTVKAQDKAQKKAETERRKAEESKK